MTQCRSYEDYLADIVDAMAKALEFVKNLSYDEFKKDDKTTFAVIRAGFEEDQPSVDCLEGLRQIVCGCAHQDPKT